ncbi:hypothetical protein BN7874_158 [Phage NCTB]|nr:hypothetical protein BN7874_158 [Phage NCTB]
MKRLFVLGAMLATALLSGCTKHIPVTAQEIGTKVNGGNGEFYDGLYRSKVIKISDWCGTTTACDKAFIMTVPAYNHVVPGEYAMPLSNDMDLTLDLEFRVKFDMSGNDTQILDRMAIAATRYKMGVTGSATSVQEQRISIETMAALDLSPAIIKTRIRPLLASYNLETAFRNIGQGGSILYGGKDPNNKDTVGILETARAYLKEIGSPLIIETVAVKRIAMPPEIINRKKENEGIEEEDEMQRKRLAMSERRRVQEHLLNMRQAADELEVLVAQAPILADPNIIAYKWTQVAQQFADAGLPFATTPEMLPIGKGGSLAVQDLEARIQSLRSKADSYERSDYYRCLENSDKTVEQCNTEFPQRTGNE